MKRRHRRGENKIPSKIIENYKSIVQKYANLKWYDYLDKITTNDRQYIRAISQSDLFYHFISRYRKSPASTYNYSTNDLIYIFKVAVLMETSMRRGRALSKSGCADLYGSVSSVPHIFYTLAENSYQEAEKVRTWAKEFGICEGYLPAGAHYVFKYSDSKQEKEEALLIIEEENRRIASRAHREAERQKKDKERTINTAILKKNDYEDRQSNLRKKFIEELDTLDITKKLHQLANDERHSPKYYPKNIIHEATNEVLKNLEKPLRDRLKEKFEKVNLKRSPWNKFKQRLLYL